jgi:hypothetical protein
VNIRQASIHDVNTTSSNYVKQLRQATTSSSHCACTRVYGHLQAESWEVPNFAVLFQYQLKNL